MGDIQTYVVGVQTYGAIQTYRGHPNIWGHPNVLGHMDTPLVWQSMLSLCCVCTGDIQTSSKHTGSIQTYVGVSKHMRASKHMGASKYTGGIPSCLPILQSRFCHYWIQMRTYCWSQWLPCLRCPWHPEVISMWVALHVIDDIIAKCIIHL